MGGPPLEVVAYSSRQLVPFQLKQNTRLVDYNSAHVGLNPESFEDEQGVMKTLRHELFHVVLSPFDLYSSTVDRALDASSSVREILDRIWNHACEKAVINLERMFSGLNESE